MRFFVALFLVALVAFLGIQAYKLISQRSQYDEREASLRKEAETLRAENSELSGDIQFYQNTENATKELQSKVNYHKPDEQMLILVPAEAGKPAEGR
jgi:cell division protein FtsB